MTSARRNGRERCGRALLGLGVLLGLFGCSSVSVLRGSISGGQSLLEQATRNGARNCAPQELALAEANLDFAETELAQGDLARAEEHFAIADPNLRAALRMSSPERCLPRERPGDADGDGILDPDDACVDEPEDFDGFEDGDGCPEDQDSDGDGVMDTLDHCPLDPEDRDGFQDEDGCPEIDNDLDGIHDPADRCPSDAEDPDGFQSEDGCPDLDNDADGTLDIQDLCPNEAGPPDEQGCPRVYQDVEVTATVIRINQRIYFEFNRAVIRERSFGILNTVAQVMRDYPNFRIEVQGHTDDRGGDQYNMRLSQQRAEAVRSYLVQQGIEDGRLTARGYGETQPLESNRTSGGRSANRRVEFHRTDEAAVSAASNEAVP